jgi:type 1 fimbria pilin
MKAQLHTVLAGCLLAVLVGTSTALAAEGHIDFSGEIVAPTCVVSQTRIDAWLSHPSGADPDSSRIACRSADTSPAAVPTTYSLTVTSLDAMTAKDNRLLAYFVGYVNAADKTGTQARLVTQIFA